MAQLWSEGEGVGIVLPSVFTSIAIPGRGFTEGSLWPCGALWMHDKGQMSDEEVDDLVLKRADHLRSSICGAVSHV